MRSVGDRCQRETGPHSDFLLIFKRMLPVSPVIDQGGECGNLPNSLLSCSRSTRTRRFPDSRFFGCFIGGWRGRNFLTPMINYSSPRMRQWLTFLGEPG